MNPAQPPLAASEAPPASRHAGDARLMRLRRGEERRLRAGHLWVFANEVDNEATPLAGFEPGQPARLRDWRERFLGHVYVNPHALICARIMSREPSRPVDHALLVERVRSALQLRQRHFPTPHYRLVFGEADLLPGLVLDRYGAVIVGQIATAGMEALRPSIEQAVAEVLAPEVLLWKNDGAARDLEQLPRELACAIGAAPQELEVLESGLQFAVPMASAQKTGWFYDQAANRAILRRLLWPGARVLDVCAYLGAWAITALRGGAREAWCVDSSAAALAGAAANAARNGCAALRTLRGDAFDVLEQLRHEGERFDVVVLDPPAFIKRRKDVARGQAAYRKLNQLAMEILERDGMLVSCSCSYHLAAGELAGLIQAAARHGGHEVQILATGGQSCDHPLHPAIPETRYLKAFFCRVTRASG